MMKKLQFNLRDLLLLTVFVAICLVAFFYLQKLWRRTDRENAAMWLRTDHENADSFYWTMRSNLEDSRATIKPAGYDRFRQKIDGDWKRLHPAFEIPTEPPAAK